MTMILAALAALSLQGRPTPVVWTWALYEGPSITLANEVPDTSRLRATFECQPRSSVARLTLYGGAPSANGFAQLSAGQSSAPVEVTNGARGANIVTLRTDHPVFAAFMASGQLNVRAQEAGVTVIVEPEHLAKLRRFAELCTG